MGGVEVRWLKYKSRCPRDRIKSDDSVAQFARIDDDLAQRWNDVLFDLKARRHDRGREKKKKKHFDLLDIYSRVVPADRVESRDRQSGWFITEKSGKKLYIWNV